MEHEELPFAYENMKYVVSNPYIKHPKCIVVSVYFPGSYNKKYHYLSKEMVSSGDTVVVPAAGESKSAIVYGCKEYQEWETLPYTYNEMKNVISIIRKPQNSFTNQTSSYQYNSKPRGHHPYYDSQMEDEYWEGSCSDDFDDYDEPFYHDVPVNHSGIWDEENEYYDMWDSIDEDNLF